jgi:hypothetical protein
MRHNGLRLALILVLTEVASGAITNLRVVGVPAEGVCQPHPGPSDAS